jgi:hypothetical protein
MGELMRCHTYYHGWGRLEWSPRFLDMNCLM